MLQSKSDKLRFFNGRKADPWPVILKVLLGGSTIRSFEICEKPLSFYDALTSPSSHGLNIKSDFTSIAWGKPAPV